LLDRRLGDTVFCPTWQRAETDKFLDVCESEDLIEANARWLRSLPNLVPLTRDEMKAEVARRIAAIPNREQRIAEDGSGALVWLEDWSYLSEVCVEGSKLRLSGRLADIETGKLVEGAKESK
jgi:hypothetical protein